MAAPNRVDDLRKRYHENPRRFFAPLANEYRKTGFLDRAVLLCEKHLGEQPDNLNGLVVYGQTLFESGRHSDAKGPFEAALNLDRENLIALRHLGDIARLEGNAEEARRWYERVLEFDRRNEEVLALLEEVGGGESKEPPSGPSSAPSIVSVASSVRVTASGPAAEAVGMIDLDTAPPVAARAARASGAAPAVRTVEVSAQPRPARRASLLDLNFDFGESPAAEAPVAAPRALEDMETLVVAPRPVAAASPVALRLTPAAPTLAAPPPAPPASSAADALFESPPEEISLGVPDKIEGLQMAEFSSDAAALPGLESSEFASEAVAPLADLDPMDFDPAGAGGSVLEGLEEREFQPPPSAAEVRRASLAGLPLIADESPDPQPLADLPQLDTTPRVSARAITPPSAPALDEEETLEISAAGVRARMETPPTFVTETMAELYLKQGFRDRAIEVYRRLVDQSPRDEALRARLAALESPVAVAPLPTLDFEVSPDTVDEPAPAPANAMLAEVSFSGVVLATPARAASAPTPAPAPPARIEPAGPSAREFLAGFARRGFTPLSSPIVGAPTSASRLPTTVLDAVFGSAVQPDDDRAAHRLAGVGATSGPSGGSALDSLFGEGPSAPLPATQPSARAVPRASDSLRFDQFFAPDAATAPADAVASAGAPEEPIAEGASAELPPEEDDLDQFQGWLRGLTQ